MSNIEQKQKILLKRTTEVDRPSIPSGASHGELFLNIASGANAHNKISTMQIGTNNPIIWSDDVANEKKFASKTELENLIQEVEDSEFVTANALTQINKSAGFTEGGISKLPDQQSLTDAIIELQENGAKGNNYVWLFPTFPYGDNIALTDEELENFKKYNMVTFKSIIPIDETFTKVCEQYYDGVKAYSDDETIKFVSFWPPQRSEDEPNPYKWQLVTFNVDISITDKTISYYAEGYYVGNFADSATTSISATTSTKAIQDGDGNVIATTYSTKEELSGAVNDIIEEIIDNELVTSTAISTMYASAGFNEDGSSVLEGGVSLSQAIIDLQARAGVIEESDPIFAKSAASGITSADITNWNNKMDFVDRVSSAYTSYSADTSVSAKTSVSATTAVSAKTSVNAVSASTSISAKTSVSATTSTKAIQDGDGNVIATTYSTKEELSGAVNDIIEEIIDNELVASTAISTMYASAGFNEDGSSVLEGGVSLSQAIIELQAMVQELMKKMMS